MQERVSAIDENFEFHRAGINRDIVDIASSALDQLYKIFDVQPVPHRILYDGKSPIVVKATRWQGQHEEMWQLLVPSSGTALTVQGKLVRIAGRISHELEDNGGINWGNDFKKMADCFYDHLTTGNPLDDDLLIEAKDLIAEIKKKQGDTDRLTQLSVLWVLQNPTPISLAKPPYFI